MVIYPFADVGVLVCCCVVFVDSLVNLTTTVAGNDLGMMTRFWVDALVVKMFIF
jgi:hypothetical protein